MANLTTTIENREYIQDCAQFERMPTSLSITKCPFTFVANLTIACVRKNGQ